MSLVRVMLDLETMSTADNAAIVQIAAVAFSGSPPLEFNTYIDPEDSKKYGEVSSETMDWWNGQDPVIRNKVFGGKATLESALISFENFLREVSNHDLKNLRIYCRGPEFDWVILRNAYHTCLGHFPFHYQSPQSSRTVDDIADSLGVEIPKVQTHEKHNALADCYAQLKSWDYVKEYILANTFLQI